MKSKIQLILFFLFTQSLFSQTFRGAYDAMENQIYETYLSQLTQPSPHDFSVTTQIGSDSVGITKEKKWRWGIIASAEYSYRSFKNADIAYTEHSGSDLGQWIYYKSKWDVPKLGYSIGLTGSLNFKKNFRIDFGFTFSDFGYKAKNIDSVFIFNQFGPGSYYYDTCYTCTTISVNDYLALLPVTLQYSFYNRGHFSYYIGAGISGSLLFREVEERDKKYITESNRIWLFSKSNVGIEWREKKINLFFQPEFTFQLALNKQGENHVRHLYSFGLVLKYNFI